LTSLSSQFERTTGPSSVRARFVVGLAHRRLNNTHAPPTAPSGHPCKGTRGNRQERPKALSFLLPVLSKT